MKQKTVIFPSRKPSRNGISVGLFVSLLCVLLSASVLTTYIFTYDDLQKKHREVYERQEASIKSLKKALADRENGSFSKLDCLAELFQAASYYSGDVSDEDLLNAVLQAYAQATGDDYACYYSEEEYAKLVADSNGEAVGVGVSVVSDEVTVDEVSVPVLHVFTVFPNTPAEQAGVQIGDRFIGIVDEENGFQSFANMGGMTVALDKIKGPVGTSVCVRALRQTEAGFETLDFPMVRANYEKQSVSFQLAEGDPTTAIVRISEFDLSTPSNFKNTVQDLQGQGVSHFVFDLRNNPGGNLESIQAVLSFFLQKDDLILSKVNRKGETVQSYFAGPMTLNYVPNCNVAENEVGVFASLDFVVLCNGNTASAAEVFVATMRDYALCKTVGTTTFGKGIMQSILSLSAVSNGVFDGYAKMTTYAYVTKCGVSYHEIGITPDETVELSDAAKAYSFYLLPQSEDNQLQKALEILSDVEN